MVEKYILKRSVEWISFHISYFEHMLCYTSQWQKTAKQILHNSILTNLKRYVKTMYKYQRVALMLEWVVSHDQKKMSAFWVASSGKVNGNKVIFKIQGHLQHLKITFHKVSNFCLVFIISSTLQRIWVSIFPHGHSDLDTLQFWALS